jgi:hypothetical protein
VQAESGLCKVVFSHVDPGSVERVARAGSLPRMEGQPQGVPLKVCPQCSVASRTDADVCPSCGSVYGRRRLQLPSPRVWLAVAIIAAAFAVGYFGIAKLIDDDAEDEGGITLEQASAVPDGISRPELEGHLGGEAPVLEQPKKGAKGVTCAYYGIADRPDAVWEFCFKGEKLVSSGQLGGQPAAAPPEGLPVPPNGQPAPAPPESGGP